MSKFQVLFHQMLHPGSVLCEDQKFYYQPPFWDKEWSKTYSYVTRHLDNFSLFPFQITAAQIYKQYTKLNHVNHCALVAMQHPQKIKQKCKKKRQNKTSFVCVCVSASDLLIGGPPTAGSTSVIARGVVSTHSPLEYSKAISSKNISIQKN